MCLFQLLDHVGDDLGDLGFYWVTWFNLQTNLNFKCKVVFAADWERPGEAEARVETGKAIGNRNNPSRWFGLSGDSGDEKWLKTS
jgi:hypothetical protein